MVFRKKHTRERVTPAPETPVILELINYNPDDYDRYAQEPVEKILKKLKDDRVNWINIDGLHDAALIEKVQQHFNLHSLLIEDVLNDQRPKAEEYEEYLFFTLKMLYRIEGNQIDYEQISFVLGDNFLISFQEKEGDLFDAFRDRIQKDLGRVRKKRADYLLYRLVDIIVDNYYQVLDCIGEQIEEIEDQLASNATEKTFKSIQDLKKELIYLRKVLYPLREALNRLVKGENTFVDDENIRFFSDVYDHVIHLTDSLDTYKDLTSSLMDIHINTQNNQLNKVIKVLTIISTIFIPLTFIVGVYGMNFEYMPELKWEYGYPMVWGIMGVIIMAMVSYFRFKKWF
jgi:magnesium transporter